ncbi:MAG: hypothetical protein P8I31_05395 [Bacteroidia bacterium]|nr:hypothetical protein [Bacteroidia bacterium]|tara:strand:+ start:10978 stop:11541 length:564 start_codon:yes stop_codon:yes gene_type:complete
MTTHKTHESKNTFYYVTFTCYRWLNLIDQSDAYHSFYKWFDYLKLNRVHLTGYVIMPNHFHGIFYVPEDCCKSINQILANGKRFIAYDIIKALKEMKKEKVLQYLSIETTEKEKRRGKKHKVFRTSSDIKELYSQDMIITKLEYIHRNPCKGKWNLVNQFTQYNHSSASYYELEDSDWFITDYRKFY